MDSSYKFNWDDTGKLLLRLTIGGLLLFHGVSKLQHGIAWMPPMLAQIGLPGFIAYGVYVGEVIAPILIIVGWKTRLASLVVAFNMLFAIWLASKDKIFTLNQGGGWTIELEALFFFGAIALCFMGAGKYSISKGRSKWD